MSSEIVVPSKEELITYIRKNNILELCSEEIKELYFVLEENSNVITIAKDTEPLLSKFTDKKQVGYAAQIQNVVIFRILSQLAKLYTRIKIDSFIKFIGNMAFSKCEEIIH